MASSTERVSNSPIEPGMRVVDVDHQLVGRVAEVSENSFSMSSPNQPTMKLTRDIVFGVGATVQLICAAPRIGAYQVD